MTITLIAISILCGAIAAFPSQRLYDELINALEIQKLPVKLYRKKAIAIFSFCTIIWLASFAFLSSICLFIVLQF